MDSTDRQKLVNEMQIITSHFEKLLPVNYHSSLYTFLQNERIRALNLLRDYLSLLSDQKARITHQKLAEILRFIDETHIHIFLLRKFFFIANFLSPFDSLKNWLVTNYQSVFTYQGRKVTAFQLLQELEYLTEKFPLLIKFLSEELEKFRACWTGQYFPNFFLEDNFLLERMLDCFFYNFQNSFLFCLLSANFRSQTKLLFKLKYVNFFCATFSVKYSDLSVSDNFVRTTSNFQFILTS